VTTVSKRLQRRIDRDFLQADEAEEVHRRLAQVADSERVQAAIILAANGNLQEFHREAELALVDWRDALVNGGLAHDDWPDVLNSELGSDLTS
jgi:hypothetical protein